MRTVYGSFVYKIGCVQKALQLSLANLCEAGAIQGCGMHAQEAEPPALGFRAYHCSGFKGFWADWVEGGLARS